jgi:phage terminase large subunit-like protein
LGETTSPLTASGEGLGTAGFSAPEVYDVDAHQVDERADVYSLGRIAAWLVTGRWPRPNHPLTPEGELRGWVLECTELAPDRRPGSIAEALERLKELTSEPATSSRGRIQEILESTPLRPEDAVETGIIVAGLGTDGLGYVLDDRSCRLPPDGWARQAIAAYRLHDADVIVAEDNNGGEMVELTLRSIDPTVPVRRVRASRGKRTRAEPIAVLYTSAPMRSRTVFHTAVFAELEDQLCSWTPDSHESPDRLDALVWALDELFVSRTTNPWAELVRMGKSAGGVA